jgi:hypothetical protein
MSDSETFEKQVHRIYELLEGSGAQVTWDEHIPDPDNLAQTRQIDISIRKDGKLIFVECRDHKSRQDVQWIEELIGRRTSLGADSLIAVSSSGFTAGALKKASRLGHSNFGQTGEIDIGHGKKGITESPGTLVSAHARNKSQKNETNTDCFHGPVSFVAIVSSAVLVPRLDGIQVIGSGHSLISDFY